jgi:tetratricopeptide (TPR) repeat protein
MTHPTCPNPRQPSSSTARTRLLVLLQHAGRLPTGFTAANPPERNLGWLRSCGLDDVTELDSSRAELEMLLGHPKEDRIGVLERARRRYSAPSLAAILLDRAAQNFHTDPEEARHLAELAERVSYKAKDLQLAILACAYTANSLRAAGKLVEAGNAFERAKHLAYKVGVEEFVAAELYSLEASLRGDQRRLPLAFQLLDHAEEHYRRLEDRAGEVRCIAQRASLHYLQGAAKAAAREARRALALIDFRVDPKLHLWAHHNLALYLLEAGEAAQARQLLETVTPLYVEADLLPRLRLLWLRGRLALALGDYEEAGKLLSRAAEAFAEGGFAVFAAMVCLDLATVHLATDSASVLQQIAAVLPVILQSEGLSHEAVAALLVFQRSVAQAALTEQLVEAGRQIFRHLHEPHVATCHSPR